MTDKELKAAIKRYNDIMDENGREYLTIGTRLSEGTEGWTIRDMVSEAQYLLELHYEDGNANEEGRHADIWKLTPEDMLNKRRFDWITHHNESEKALHADWLHRTRRLRNFINKYKGEALKTNCKERHCSDYDN